MKQKENVVKTGSVSKKMPFKKLKATLRKEYDFLKGVFSLFHIPIQMKGDSGDSLVYSSGHNKEENPQVKSRAEGITDLEEKLQKMKSEKTFTLKNKYQKKSLTSKLNKKIKKKERVNSNKQKPIKVQVSGDQSTHKEPTNVNVAKPIFNHDGKLVFSKFDFANLGHEKSKRGEKDPKKILDGLKKQDEKVKALEQTIGSEKVSELKDKLAWKVLLKKAEGEKVKDDPTLLKKSIKKMEQKKKQSKKQWTERVTNVEQKKQDRQKKRQENLSKKKKEKKAKIVKTAVKRGRVVI